MDRKLDRRLLLTAAIVLGLALPLTGPVLASEIFDEQIVVINDDIDDDVYAFGETVTVNATIDGDLIAFGNQITINGTVTGDVMAGGQIITINGTVEDDLRAGGMIVMIAEGAVVGDDANLVGMAIEMQPESSVGGDAFFGAYQATLNDVEGNVSGGGNGVLLNGRISGDVELGVGDAESAGFNPLLFMQQNPSLQLPPLSDVPGGLSFGADGTIKGDLSYSSTSESDFAAGVVDGQIDFEQDVVDTGSDGGISSGFFGPMTVVRRIGFFVGTFIALLALGLLFQRFVPTFLEGASTTLRKRILPSLGAGCLGYIVFGLLAMVGVGLIIVFGIVLGVIGMGRPLNNVLGLFVNVIIVGFRLATWWLPPILVALPLGAVIYRQFSSQEGEKEARFWPLVIGLFIVALILAIPFVGGVTRFVLSIFGFGAVVLYFWPKQEEAVKLGGEPAPAVATGPEADKPAE